MTAPFSFEGKTILVTGASSEIGRAVCRLIGEQGGTPVLTGRDPRRLEEAARDMGGTGARKVVADLSLGTDRASLAEKAPELDGAVFAAGALDLTPVGFITEEKLRRIQQINYEAPLFLTQFLLKKRKLKEGASVVFITSIAGLVGARGHIAYSGTKGALEAAARSLALETASRGVRVNCIAPGMVGSGMSETVRKTLGEAVLNQHEKEYPLGPGTPRDVAGAAVFLLSDAARWITGTTLVCDGGFTAK